MKGTKVYRMKVMFACPENHQVFKTNDFELIEHHGIKLDDAGDRYLDARVAMTSPCPFCGKMHIFHASELICPFSSSNESQRNTK